LRPDIFVGFWAPAQAGGAARGELSDRHRHPTAADDEHVTGADDEAIDCAIAQARRYSPRSDEQVLK
jgi:hypothetical protein